ncbi:hypothetical protein ASE36_12135 [Rhizobium sp. Root274]|uniref:DUF2793 domain-containing protein n=1 Tax=unclassified Rhizobium TaxID=2613769 RepID=UPI0007160F64|nr:MULTISPECIES: DUF2793 domain-containing protein [unclassified Rhizobium]KQW29197.1 hypothetical protein ASC71_12155 [Rhizobium sp. Root1240]KRD29393.1 hypothetical protein ASE36_12135 [Rhizobium sp. Root274]
MSDTTTRLDLPYILPAQAQKHVTHNEALQRLDAVVQLVIDSERSDPPDSPAEGEIHWIGGPGTGAFAGRDGMLAARQDGVWTFIAPQSGWQAVFRDSGTFTIFDGSEWQVPALPDDLLADRLGISGTPDAYNRLLVQSPGSLFNHAGGSHRMSINKAATGETASLIFQSNWQARTEMGLAGEDRFSFKMYGDATGWRQAIAISPEGYVHHDQRPLARAALSSATFTPAAGSFTGFDTLHLAGGDMALGAALSSEYGRRLIVPASGYYLLALTATADDAAHTLHVSRNGSADIASHSGSAGTSSTTALAWLNSGDTLTLRHANAAQYQFGYGRTELCVYLL